MSTTDVGSALEALEGEDKNIDFLLRHNVGGSGRWQWFLLLSFFPVFFASGYPLLLHTLVAYEPAHRCEVPVCDNHKVDKGGIYQNWTKFALPHHYSTKVIFSDGQPFDPCRRFRDQGLGACAPSNFDSNTSETCQTFIYDRNDYPANTLTTDLNLVCGQDTKRRLLGLVMMLGMMLGSAVGGRLGDRIGRKKCVFLGLSAIGPSLLVAGFAPTLEAYAALQLVWCSALPLIWVNAHSCLLECFGADSRVSVICIKDLFWPMELATLALVGYLLPNWKHLQWASGIICTLPLLTWPLIPESVRWLAQNHKRAKAFAILEGAARTNGRPLTEAGRHKVDQVLRRIDESSRQSRRTLSFFHMFERAHLAKSLVLVLAWATINVAGYTLALSVTRLSGNLHLNFALGALAEVPGSALIYFGHKHSRRQVSMAGFLLVLSTACISLAFIPKRHTKAVLAVYLMGKCVVGAAFQMVWLVTTELYPTNLRAQALGACSTVARIFGLVCPFLADLGVIWKPLPMLALGLPAAGAGIMALFVLPESRHASLPQDMEDAARLTRNKSSNNTKQ